MSTGRGRTAWVIGGAGFLGRHVARRLATEGWIVHGLGHGTFTDIERLQWGYTRWIADTVTPDSLAVLQRRSGAPALIFHAAGGASVAASIADPARDHARTVGSIAVVLDHIERTGISPLLIYPSSAAVYGGRHEPIAETAPCVPVSPYGRHKLEAERLCLQAVARGSVNCVIVRWFSLYGPTLRKQVLWDVGNRIVSGEEPIMLGGTGAETRDFLYVDDAATLVALIARDPQRWPSIVNGASGEPVRIGDIVARLAQALGCRPRFVFSGRQRPGDPPHLTADIALANRNGFAPAVPLAEGIAAYAAWLSRERRRASAHATAIAARQQTVLGAHPTAPT